jgi:hypothetical protein
MTVYVDDMRATLGRMVMCHMAADTEAELHAMADAVGVARRHHQGDHYDICKAKRAAAVKRGAREVTRRELLRIVRPQRKESRMIPRSSLKEIAKLNSQLEAIDAAKQRLAADKVSGTFIVIAEWDDDENCIGTIHGTVPMARAAAELDLSEMRSEAIEKLAELGVTL